MTLTRSPTSECRSYNKYRSGGGAIVQLNDETKLVDDTNGGGKGERVCLVNHAMLQAPLRHFSHIDTDQSWTSRLPSSTQIDWPEGSFDGKRLSFADPSFRELRRQRPPPHKANRPYRYVDPRWGLSV